MYSDTPLIMVDDAETLTEIAARLARAPAIGVDTESDSFYSYQEKVCLIQISDLDADYIIDPLTIGDLSALAPIMANPDIVKVFHGADYDVVCMKRDYAYTFRSLFDTMIASQLLGSQRVGLADLIEEHFGVALEKKYQRYDWGRRPLGAEHIEYARGDSHWLPALREILIRRLKKRGRLEHLIEECALLESRTWEGRPFDEDGYLKVKTAGRLDHRGLRVLRRLYLYRDEQARKMDRPVFKVIGDTDLVRIADGRPTTRSELDKVLPGKMGLKRRHADALARAVRLGLEDDFPIPERKPKQPAPTGPTPRLRGRAAERALAVLKAWRNDLVKANADLTPVAAISNGTLKEISRLRPLSAEEMGRVPEVRRWQVQDYGNAILAILDRVAPWTEADEAGYQKRRKRARGTKKKRQ
ncbi:MAG: HRDC domain-containing protein [Deltaproteobacteria bacterium]|nr:HRDC domain-containing protein [Deltaproteobacteria bacterium]